MSQNSWKSRYCGISDFVVGNDRQWHKVTNPNLTNLKLGWPQRSKSHVLIRNRIFLSISKSVHSSKVSFIRVLLTLKIYSRTSGLLINCKISFRILTVELLSSIFFKSEDLIESNSFKTLGSVSSDYFIWS